MIAYFYVISRGAVDCVLKTEGLESEGQVMAHRSLDVPLTAFVILVL